MAASARPRSVLEVLRRADAAAHDHEVRRHALGDEDLAPPRRAPASPSGGGRSPAKPIATRSSGRPSAALPSRRRRRGRRAPSCGRSSSGRSIGKRAATSRSIAIAASPQRSISAAMTRLRRSRPSPASAERRCQTTFAPCRRATQAAGEERRVVQVDEREAVLAHQPARAGGGAAAARRPRGRGRASAGPRTASPRRARRSRRRPCGRSRPRRRRAPPPGPPGRRRAARSAGRGCGSAARATTARRRAAAGGGRRGSGSASRAGAIRRRSPRSGARCATGSKFSSACVRAARAERRAALRVAQQLGDGVGERVDAEVVDEHAGLARDDDAAAGARARRDDRARRSPRPRSPAARAPGPCDGATTTSRGLVQVRRCPA